MKEKNKTYIMITLSMFVTIGVVISPILRFEGFAPTAHFVNIVCSVFMGPWYSLANAILTAFIRMTFLSIPPLAVTGQVFGAVLSGILYRKTKGSIIAAVIGEIIGTGIIGAIISAPVMTLFLGNKNVALFYYIPSFFIATLLGGSVAFIFLKTLQGSNMLIKIQNSLGIQAYEKSKRPSKN